MQHFADLFVNQLFAAVNIFTFTHLSHHALGGYRKHINGLITAGSGPCMLTFERTFNMF